MSVYKDTKNNTWKVYYRFTDWQGKVHQSTKRGFSTKREALAWEREQLHKVESDLDMTFESFIDIYTASMKNRLKENTWHTKEHIIRTKLLPYFAKRKMNSIQPKDVIAWQNEMIQSKDRHGESYSPVYLKTLHNQLSAIFNYAVKFYGLKDNPAAKVGNMGKAKAREMLFWTQEEYRKFSEVMMDKPVSFYAFEMLYWCGIREGELLALTPADFDFDRETVTINKSYQRIGGRDIITDPETPKNNRTIKMPEFLCEEMQDFIKHLYRIGKNDRLFEVTKSYLHHEMERGAKAAGVKRIRIHDLRHPYVKPTTKIFSLRLMDFQAQAYPDAQRKTRGACQLHQGEQSRSSVRPLCNRKQFPCLPPQSKISRILYAISMCLSGYLKEHRKATYATLLTSGRLNSHLAEIDRQAEKMFFRLVKQMAEAEGVTEELKAADPMAWAGKMNSVRSRAAETVNETMVYGYRTSYPVPIREVAEPPKIFWKYYDLYRRKRMSLSEYAAATGLSAFEIRHYLMDIVEKESKPIEKPKQI